MQVVLRPWAAQGLQVVLARGTRRAFHVRDYVVCFPYKLREPG